MSPRNSCIEDFPEPVMVNILSRLPVKTIVHCKCVCKKWLNIVLDSNFADLQLSKSPAGYMVCYKSGILKWVDVEDKLNHHSLHHDPIMSLDLINLAPIFQSSMSLPVGSVNGLVCLWQVSHSIDNTYICNPITREYMILPRSQYYKEGFAFFFYCFGVGSYTQKYKVKRIFQKNLYPEAEVYTLGTGHWRSPDHVPAYRFKERYGQFLNGHAHWITGDQDSGENICAFSFDNKTFGLFPSPPFEKSWICFQRLGVLKGCLCQCKTYNSKLKVWVMKEYGIMKSWHKELVIKHSISPNLDMPILQPVFLVDGFKDGTILMATYGYNLMVYCPQKKAIIETEIFDSPFRFRVAYRLSFHRLQNFENESVHVFGR